MALHISLEEKEDEEDPEDPTPQQNHKVIPAPLTKNEPTKVAMATKRLTQAGLMCTRLLGHKTKSTSCKESERLKQACAHDVFM